MKLDGIAIPYALEKVVPLLHTESEKVPSPSDSVSASGDQRQKMSARVDVYLTPIHNFQSMIQNDDYSVKRNLDLITCF